MRKIDTDKLCKDLAERWHTADKNAERNIREVIDDVVLPIIACQPTIETEPKAVNYISTGYADGQPVYDEAECPCCGRIYEEGDMAWDEAKYCMNCGQPLLWDWDSEEEEE